MGHNEYIHHRYNSLRTFVALFCFITLSNKSAHRTWLKCRQFVFTINVLTGTSPVLVFVFLHDCLLSCLHAFFQKKSLSVKKQSMETHAFTAFYSLIYSICVESFYLILTSHIIINVTHGYRIKRKACWAA